MSETPLKPWKLTRWNEKLHAIYGPVGGINPGGCLSFHDAHYAGEALSHLNAEWSALTRQRDELLARATAAEERVRVLEEACQSLLSIVAAQSGVMVAYRSGGKPREAHLDALVDVDKKIEIARTALAREGEKA